MYSTFLANATVETSAYIAVVAGFGTVLAWLLKSHIPLMQKTFSESLDKIVATHEKGIDKICGKMERLTDRVDVLENTVIASNAKDEAHAEQANSS